MEAFMLSHIYIAGSADAAREAVLDRLDQKTRQQLPAGSLGKSTALLSTGRFSPRLSLVIRGIEYRHNEFAEDTVLSTDVETAEEAMAIASAHVTSLPSGHDLAIALDLEPTPVFVAWFRPKAIMRRETGSYAISLAPLTSPLGQQSTAVLQWFDALTDGALPDYDGTLVTAERASKTYSRAAKAVNTRRTYRSVVRSWCSWTARHGIPALPARSEDVAAYLADLALQKKRPATVDIHRAALRYLHHIAQVPVPTSHALVSETVAGIRRTSTGHGSRQVKGLTWDLLSDVIEQIDTRETVGVRDKAILLLGFAGALRRSEVAALCLENVALDDDGMRIRLDRSKGDRTSQGVEVAIPRGVTGLCPVRAYEAWLRKAQLKETKGPVFRRVWLPPVSEPGDPPLAPSMGSEALSDRSVARIIQKRCLDAGLVGDFSGHSLRRGAITTGARDGIDLVSLKRFSRHQTFGVVEKYIEVEDAMTKHPGRSRF
jgi:site-specific recombinase XerD